MASQYRPLILKKGKEQSIGRYHRWVFSGALKENQDLPENGEVVELYNSRGEYLATGYYNEGNIAIRILTFKKQALDNTFWEKVVRRAFDLRVNTGLAGSSETTGYRLFFAEGDYIPGLVIDWYNGAAVIQTHSKGVENFVENIFGAISAIYGDQLKSVFHTSAIKKNELIEKYLSGQDPGGWFEENGLRVYARWEKGQKTGYFLDQRDNRYLLRKFSKDKNVLDAFCHAGGFALNALREKADHVTLVDSSESVLNQADINLKENGFSNFEIQSSDVYTFLKNSTKKFDLMIIDPPSFAKHQSSRHKAIQGYKRLNIAALRNVNPGGILFTFSCSQVVDKVLFENTIRAAAIESGRMIRVLYRLTQPPDHPVNIFHPESEYLKGLVLEVV